MSTIDVKIKMDSLKRVNEEVPGLGQAGHFFNE